MSDPRYGGYRVTRLKALVLSEYGDICHLCGRPGADTVDHLIPRSLGGDDSLAQCRPAHQSCNSARGNMTLEQWHAKHSRRGRRSEPSRKW